MNITIRKAKPKEADELTVLSMRSKQSNGYDDAFMDACREELTITASDFLTTEYWVAEEKSICGVIGLCVDENGQSGEVVGFFVDPEYKRRSIGRLLWQTLVTQAQSRGIKSLRLDADPAAVPFYEAQGFCITGEVPSGSIEGRSLPHMVCTLG